MYVLCQRLKRLNVGCYLCNMFVSWLLYADDILLLSHSCSAMQAMLDVCKAFSTDYDLHFNIKKCSYLKIGTRFDKSIKDFTLGNDCLKHADSITYLGVCFCQGKSLKFNYSNVKANFYKLSTIYISKVCSSQ